MVINEIHIENVKGQQSFDPEYLLPNYKCC